MENLVTILYYTSNKEEEGFERRIRDLIIENSNGLPIVSVSHKPIDFGKNIYVGDVGASGFNMFRQVLIGCKACDSKFIISAEADCVYPPDYFTWIPTTEDRCYRNSNLYVMPQHRTFFWRKEEGATHAQVVGREFYINTLERLFEGEPEWDLKIEQKNFPKEKFHKRGEDVFRKTEIEFYETESPVVQIKTSRSMRHFTNSDRVDRHEIPFWGKGSDFRDKFYNIGYRH
jgi:hypothetical protein